MKHPNRILLLAGILLVATTLRAPFTIVGPLLAELQTRFALGATQLGLLLTGPLLAFSAIAPLAAGVARRWGIERTLFGALALIASGVLVRAAGGVISLYAGTLVIGTGIALGNVLLPSLLKREFPDRVPALTALYVLAMGIAAAAGSALVPPLAAVLHGDWQAVSRLPLVLVAVAALAWLPQAVQRPRLPAPAAMPSAAMPSAAMSAAAPIVMWRTPLAWQVTAYLGLDCFLYYVGVSWLPAILRDTAGYSTAQAASLHGMLLLATALPGLVLIPLAPRLRDQRLAAAALALCTTVGVLGFLVAPAHAVWWIVFFGVGAGGGLILALALISLRTGHAGEAAALSGMAQCVGYFFAAAGPPLVGSMHEAAGSWHAPLAVCAALGVAMAAVGLFAGRDQLIGQAAQGWRGAVRTPWARTGQSAQSFNQLG